MSLLNNGGYIGDRVGIAAIQGGVWSLSEHEIRERELTWRPPTSAQELVNAGYSTDGVYLIDLPVVGETNVYCLLDSKWDGGGWMLAMKATDTGTTFGYDATYWTANNTLNETDVTLDDGDAKYDVFNYYEATDIAATFPDTANGGIWSSSQRGWTWTEENFNSGVPISLTEFFSTKAQTYLLEDANITSWAGHSGGPFSAQGGWRKYGWNLSDGDGKSRWGFLWNNEGSPGSSDVYSGIGMGGTGSGTVDWSCGDKIDCCESYTGVNRQMRVELWVR